MSDFELDAVLYFMIQRGGRVRNHELVTHFKNFLNHPNNKAENREKFKNYVNELATIKLDAGEKVLVLKRKYRPNSDTFDSSGASSSSSFTASTSYTPQTKSSVGAKANMSEPNLADHQPDNSASTDKDSEPVQHDSPRAQSEPPAASNVGRGKETDVDNPDGGGFSKVRSDEMMEVQMRNTDRAAPAASKAGNGGSMNSITGSKDSLASSSSQRSAGSSTSGVASMEDDPNASVISVKDKIKKLNKIHSESDVTQPRHGGPGGGNKKSYKHGGDDDDSSHSSGASYVALDAAEKDWMVTCSTTEYHDMNRLLSKNPNLAKLKDFTNTALHWAAKSGKAEVIKLIANKPGVNVDQRSGYTPLHLAAIHGHEHIIELLVQTFKADANLRDYSGKKAKQYLKNSASSKAQQLLVSRRIGSDMGSSKSLDDSFIRTASMRMSNRAKAMSSLMQAKSAIARQPLLKTSWGGSAEDVFDDRNQKTPPSSANSSPGSSRKRSDMDLMPPPSNAMISSRARRERQRDRSKSSSRESSPSPNLSHKNDENQNMMRSGSDSAIETRKDTIV